MNTQKVVLITGATSGIGKVTAEFLSDKGYKVYGTGRNPKENGQKFSLLQMDVRDEESIKNAVITLLEKENHIDYLINNAGVGIGGAVEETPIKEFRNVFTTNTFGAISVIQAVLPIMRKQKNGFIINITSIAGYMGLPYRAGYSASKGALELITESLRMEVKPFNIRVTNIAPGDFATDIASRRYHNPVIKGSPYEEIYQKSLDMMNAHVDKGSNPLDMAKKIFLVMQKKNPKIHYKQGSFLQKFSIVLKRILPDTWYERMLMDHYKL